VPFGYVEVARDKREQVRRIAAVEETRSAC
jgi:hypothetical protein